MFEAAAPDKLIVNVTADLAEDVRDVAKKFVSKPLGAVVAALASPFLALYRLARGLGHDLWDVIQMPFWLGKDVCDVAYHIERNAAPGSDEFEDTHKQVRPSTPTVAGIAFLGVAAACAIAGILCPPFLIGAFLAGFVASLSFIVSAS